MVQAGAGVSTITPPLGTSLCGLFEDRPARTVADDLHVRALVLDDGSNRIALVLCDLICLGSEAVNAAKDRIATRSGIPASHVMISCTHTHTGPATVPLFATEPDLAYMAWLPTRIADAVAIACANLQPAQLAKGSTEVGRICFQRRFRMRDGTVAFNPGIRTPDVVEAAGPVDPEVTALLVRHLDGMPLALWANLSLHYVGTDDPLAVSADYFGDAARVVSRALGPRCMGMLTNGTSGDINNIDISGAGMVDPPSVRSAQVATAVAGAAIAATLMAPSQDEIALDARLIPFEVTRRSITPEDVALAERILANDGDPATEVSRGFSFVTGRAIPSRQIRAYARETLALAGSPTSRSTVLQVIRLGDLTIVGLPGEVFAEFGLRIKASASDRTAVVSLANDYVGYLPTLRAFSDGAYETWAARSAWPAPGTGEAMTGAVLSTMREMSTGLPVRHS